MGITNFVFEYKKSKVATWDVGGQKNERKKWQKCFQGAVGIIYLVSLSDYDQVVYESVDSSEEQNRMKEALEIFDKTINGDWFQNTKIHLIFNKKGFSFFN